MGLLYIFFGILFFFTPTLRTLDLLPDFFGCLLILIGLSKLYVIEYRLEEARSLILKYAIFSFIKIPLSFYIVFSAKKYLLPFSFLCSVVEIIILAGFFVKLFGGFEYLLSRDTEKKTHFSKIESASISCFIFSIAKGIASFVPELLVLGEQTEDYNYTFKATFAQNAALLKPYVEVFLFVLIGIFGIFCTVLCAKFFISLCRDKEIVTSFLERYSKYEIENARTLTLRKAKLIFFIFFAGLFFLLNPIFDSKNYLPNTIAYLFFIFGSFLLTKIQEDKKIKHLLLYIPLIPLSIYNNVMQYRLFSGTDIRILGDMLNIRKIPEILQSTDYLLKISLPVIAEYLILTLLLFCTLKSISKIKLIENSDTISLFEILLIVFSFVFFLSSAYSLIGEYMRTAFTFVSQDINVFLKYDSLLEISSISTYVSFVLLLYSAYRYGGDTLFSIKNDV